MATKTSAKSAESSFVHFQVKGELVTETARDLYWKEAEDKKAFDILSCLEPPEGGLRHIADILMYRKQVVGWTGDEKNPIGLVKDSISKKKLHKMKMSRRRLIIERRLRPLEKDIVQVHKGRGKIIELLTRRNKATYRTPEEIWQRLLGMKRKKLGRMKAAVEKADKNRAWRKSHGKEEN